MSPVLFFAVAALPGCSRTPVTTPEQEFGHQVGADYELVNYSELQVYWETLAEESDRMVLDTIGFSEQGRPQLMAILTSPENHADLDRYKDIARRMAMAEGVSEDEARGCRRKGRRWYGSMEVCMRRRLWAPSSSSSWSID